MSISTSFADALQLIRESVNITRTADKAIAALKSYNSAKYTKLANNILRLQELEAEVKEIKEEIKQDTRTEVMDLFEDAEDSMRTRVVDTVSFILTLSKDPKATETYKYAEIIKELTSSLTPELIAKLEELKAKYKSVVQKPPSLKLHVKTDAEKATNEEYISEAVTDFMKEKAKFIISKLKDYVTRIKEWGTSYDKKLADLKVKAKSLKESVFEPRECSECGKLDTPEKPHVTCDKCEELFCDDCYGNGEDEMYCQNCQD